VAGAIVLWHAGQFDFAEAGAMSFDTADVLHE